jgi:phosphoserine phosphatase RsbX
MSGQLGRVEWSVASRPAAGHTESGDFSCVREAGEAVLLAVGDALGHGTGAAASGRRFLDVLEVDPIPDLPSLFARCDKLFRSDRGAVLTAALLFVKERLIRYLGVGNVQAVIVRARTPGRDWFLVRSGVVGSGVGRLEDRTISIEPGDVLVLATDGIHAAYATAINPLEPIDRIARAVLDAHGRNDDDSLVLAARFHDSPREEAR